MDEVLMRGGGLREPFSLLCLVYLFFPWFATGTIWQKQLLVVRFETRHNLEDDEEENMRCSVSKVEVFWKPSDISFDTADDVPNASMPTYTELSYHKKNCLEVAEETLEQDNLTWV